MNFDQADRLTIYFHRSLNIRPITAGYAERWEATTDEAELLRRIRIIAAHQQVQFGDQGRALLEFGDALAAKLGVSVCGELVSGRTAAQQIAAERSALAGESR